MKYTHEHAFLSSKYHNKLHYITSLRFKDVYNKKTSFFTDIYYQMGVFVVFVACKSSLNYH